MSRLIPDVLVVAIVSLLVSGIVRAASRMFELSRIKNLPTVPKGGSAIGEAPLAAHGRGTRASSRGRRASDYRDVPAALLRKV